MALDRRELLRRIGMGGLATALAPMAGVMAPARSDGMVPLPVSQEVELVPATVITPELVMASTFDGWVMTSATFHADRDCLTKLSCDFVYMGRDRNGLDDLRRADLDRYGNLSRRSLQAPAIGDDWWLHR